jgi:bis(5'-nucleosyl)-tetraphosphatase (symmetrical)
MTWVLGDLHGCRRTLERLLERIGWRPGLEPLWLVGDLVNKGPSSLGVLRWARANDRHLTVVLGNHDVHLLARAAGRTEAKDGDTLHGVLEAPDREELLDWLRGRPFVHYDGRNVMVHAGLWPGWQLEEALELSTATGRLLVADDSFLERLLSKPRWGTTSSDEGQLAAAAAVFTRLRMVRSDGRPRFGFTGRPEDAPDGDRPWFAASKVVQGGLHVVFGHWAMLGLYRAAGVTCLDSGCVYGGSLSALHLEDGEIVQQPLVDPLTAEEG